MRRQQQSKITTAEGTVLSGRARGLGDSLSCGFSGGCLLTVQWGISSALIHNAKHPTCRPQPTASPAERPEEAVAQSRQSWPSSAGNIFIGTLSVDLQIL